MEIKKGKIIYKNVSKIGNDYMIPDYAELQEFLRERSLTTNGLNSEQTTAERLIFDEMNKCYSDYYLVEYIDGQPNEITEITTVEVKI